jgi:dynein intermediate chain 3, axonemal
LELALQENEILDVFYDDWAALSIDGGSFGSKADNHPKVS